MPPIPSDDKRWEIVIGTMRRHAYGQMPLVVELLAPSGATPEALRRP